MTFLALLSLSSYADESSVDKTPYYFNEIVSRWQDASATGFDTEALGNTLLSGRCYTRYQQSPSGSALVFEQRNVDNGPIGAPSEFVVFGQQTWSNSANYFDSMNYSGFKFMVSTGQIRETLQEIYITPDLVGIDDYAVKYLNGMYYAVKFDRYDSNYAVSACYYFKNNN